jgi:hypothetical protein
MAEKMRKWPSCHGQLTKIRLSGGCGGKTITAGVKFGYDHHGFERYLGYVSKKPSINTYNFTIRGGS